MPEGSYERRTVVGVAGEDVIFRKNSSVYSTACLIRVVCSISCRNTRVDVYAYCSAGIAAECSVGYRYVCKRHLYAVAVDDCTLDYLKIYNANKKDNKNANFAIYICNSFVK